MPGADVSDVQSDVADPWAAVVGQDELVTQLRRAVQHPTHAYLFVGGTGWGTRAAARAMAGEILAGGAPAEERDRHLRLAAAERHPAMTVVERVGASISAGQADDIVRQAARTPSEGTRQVLVLVDFHLVRDAAPKLLKTIEEPPSGTFFVILAEDVPPELVTIASRCIRFDFAPIATAAIEAALVAEGCAPEVATAAAGSAGGDLERARLLAGDPLVVERRRFWFDLPTRLDGSGARAAAMALEAIARMDEVAAPLAVRHEAELAALAEEAERMGVKKGVNKEVAERHKREVKRVHADELRAGLAALMARYREAAAGGDAASLVRAGELVRDLEARLVFNPGEELQLQALFVSLPPLRA